MQKLCRNNAEIVQKLCRSVSRALHGPMPKRGDSIGIGGRADCSPRVSARVGKVSESARGRPWPAAAVQQCRSTRVGVGLADSAIVSESASWPAAAAERPPSQRAGLRQR